MISTGPFSPRTPQRLAALTLDERAPRSIEPRRRRAQPDLAQPERNRARPGRPSNSLLDRLSPREREVLLLLVRRYSDREIADALSISYRTVTTHVASIFNKFGVNSRREAAALASSPPER
jgi:DNA-binding CsgD family transcriptional regulator